MIKKKEAGDAVLGQIAGHAINQDGRSNGLTAPNGPSQVRLIRDALGTMEGSDVSNIEAHGTGTSVGDPIEVQAIVEAIGRERDNALLVGSAKTNYGHCETAAGVLGVLKVLLEMEQDVIARHLHMSTLNECIGTGLMEGMSGVVPLESIEWKRVDRVSGVSSFGFSGTNAHVMIRSVAREMQLVEENLANRVCGKTEKSMNRLVREYEVLMKEK